MKIVDYSDIEKNIEELKNYFGEILREQYQRVQKMLKEDEEVIDFSKLRPIKIGIIDGDGIGPYITREAHRIISLVLENEIKNGNVILEYIEGLTLERRISQLRPVPEDVLQKIKNCHVLLKGPTTTPKATEGIPNIESANVFLRRELDLFANVRPVKVSQEGINWVFFRENTEDLYTLGSKGVEIKDYLE